MGREGECKEWRKEARQSSRKLASLKEKELHSHTKLQAQTEWRQHLSETAIENKHSQHPDSTSLQREGGRWRGRLEGVEVIVALTVTVALAASSWLRLRGRERARR